MSNVVLTSVHDNLVDYVLAHGLNPNVVVPLINQAAAEAIAGWGVTGVSVTYAESADPYEAEATTRQLLAEVQGTGEYSQNVTWTVSGNISPLTVIDANGLLTVDAGEFIDADENNLAEHIITIIAKSVDNQDVSGTVSFTCHTGYYSVLYDANGGTETMTDPSSPYKDGVTVTILENTFVAPVGKVFDRWAYDNINPGVSPEPTLTIDSNLTIYALWKDIYTVEYNANGGAGTMTDDDSPYDEGDTITVATNTFTPPTDAAFIKWNTAADGSGTDYAPAATFDIIADTTLYAIWRYAIVEEPVATATYLYVEPFSSEDPTFVASLGEDDSITLSFAEWKISEGAVDGGASFNLELAYPVVAGMYVVNEPLTTGDSFEASLPIKFTNTTFPIRNTSSLVLPNTMNVGFFRVTPN